jgi:hypothetical protein
VHYAQRVAATPRTELLRRRPPVTLAPEAEPYPKDLVGL